MERTVLLAAATWIGGVGAWTVGAGYVLAPRLQSYVRENFYRDSAPPCMLDEGKPVDVDVLPAPRAPQDLSVPADVEEPADAEPLPGDTEKSDELQLIRPDGNLVISSGLLTESQQRRLAPIKSLKRVRRSRKLRVVQDRKEKYVPIVLGARATTEESIMAAAAGPKEAKREQGEDYYVDPVLLQQEMNREAAAEARRKSFKLKDDSYRPEKLREELVAPYKNNVIGVIVVGVGVVGIIFALFPNLLENNVATSIASFPDSL